MEELVAHSINEYIKWIFSSALSTSSKIVKIFIVSCNQYIYNNDDDDLYIQFYNLY